VSSYQRGKLSGGTTMANDPDKPSVTALSNSNDPPQRESLEQTSARLLREHLSPPKDESLKGDLERPAEAHEPPAAGGQVHSYLSRFSFTDLVVLVVNECLGVPLCIAGGENFAHTDWVGSAIGWGVGIPLCVSGVTFPFWRGHVKTAVATWVEKRWQLLLPPAVLLAFIYAVGPVMYRRATAPIVTATPSETGFTQQQVDAKVANAVANLNAQLTEANRQKDAVRRDADAFRQQIQNAPPQPPAPEDQIPVSWQPDFQLNWYAGPKIAWVRFLGVSSALARIKEAYVISTLTGHKEPLDVANPTNINERWKINQIEPIPLGATVILVYEPKPSPSLPDFISQWGAFELHVVYDSKEYVKIYSQDYINSKMGREMPGVFGPRVTPRNDK
jgi:hypothetical protein